MGRAGRAVAEQPADGPEGRTDPRGGGPGNNGGDGLCRDGVGRQGYRVSVILLGSLDRMRGDAAEAARDGRGETLTPEQAPFHEADLVIDALFGTGSGAAIWTAPLGRWWSRSTRPGGRSSRSICRAVSTARLRGWWGRGGQGRPDSDLRDAQALPSSHAGTRLLRPGGGCRYRHSARDSARWAGACSSTPWSCGGCFRRDRLASHKYARGYAVPGGATRRRPAFRHRGR